MASPSRKARSLAPGAPSGRGARPSARAAAGAAQPWNADQSLWVLANGDVVDAEGQLVLRQVSPATADAPAAYQAADGRPVNQDVIEVMKGGALDGNDLPPPGDTPDEAPPAAEPQAAPASEPAAGVNPQQQVRLQKLRRRLTETGGALVNNVGDDVSIREAQELAAEIRRTDPAIRQALEADEIDAERLRALYAFVQDKPGIDLNQPRATAQDEARVAARERAQRNETPVDAGQSRRDRVTRDLGITERQAPLAGKKRQHQYGPAERANQPNFQERALLLREEQDRLLEDAALADMTGDLVTSEELFARAEAMRDAIADAQRKADNAPTQQANTRSLLDEQERLLKQAAEAESTGDTRARDQLLSQARQLDPMIADARRASGPNPGLGSSSDMSNRDRIAEATETAAGFAPSRNPIRTQVPLTPAERLELTSGSLIEDASDVDPGVYYPDLGQWGFEILESRRAPTSTPEQAIGIEDELVRRQRQLADEEQAYMRLINRMRSIGAAASDLNAGGLRGRMATTDLLGPVPEGSVRVVIGPEVASNVGRRTLAMMDEAVASRQRIAAQRQSIASLKNQLRRIGTDDPSLPTSSLDTAESMPILGEAGVQNLSAQREGDSARKGMAGTIPISRRLSGIQTLTNMRQLPTAVPPGTRIGADGLPVASFGVGQARGATGRPAARSTSYPTPLARLIGTEGNAYYDTLNDLIDRSMLYRPLSTPDQRQMMAEDIDRLLPLAYADPSGLPGYTASNVPGERMVELDDRVLMMPGLPQSPSPAVGNFGSQPVRAPIPAPQSRLAPSAPGPAETVAQRVARLTADLQLMEADDVVSPTQVEAFRSSVQRELDSLAGMDPNAAAPAVGQRATTAIDDDPAMQDFERIEEAFSDLDNVDADPEPARLPDVGDAIGDTGPIDYVPTREEMLDDLRARYDIAREDASMAEMTGDVQAAAELNEEVQRLAEEIEAIESSIPDPAPTQASPQPTPAPAAQSVPGPGQTPQPATAAPATPSLASPADDWLTRWIAQQNAKAQAAQGPAPPPQDDWLVRWINQQNARAQATQGPPPPPNVPPPGGTPQPAPQPTPNVPPPGGTPQPPGPPPPPNAPPNNPPGRWRWLNNRWVWGVGGAAVASGVAQQMLGTSEAERQRQRNEEMLRQGLDPDPGMAAMPGRSSNALDEARAQQLIDRIRRSSTFTGGRIPTQTAQNPHYYTPF